MALYQAGNFTQAATRLTEAIAAEMTDRGAWLFLAAAFKHLGNDKDATKAFERSLTLKSTNLPIYDTPVKITSKYTQGIKGDDSSSRSNYAVAVELCADGKVGIIIPYLPSYLERWSEIIYAAKKIKFEPAVKDGKPVTVIFVQEFSFSHN